MPSSKRSETQAQLASLKKSFGQMEEETPALAAKFVEFADACTVDGALPCKTKEFIILGSAVACHCPPCIILHVNKLLELGATRAEILDAAQVGVVMGGGPGYTNMQYVFQALDDAEA